MKQYFLLLLIFLPFTIRCQITLNAQLPAAGIVVKDQLWNLVIVNNNSELANVSIKMKLEDVLTGETIFTANGGGFSLGKGVVILNSQDIQPIVYNYNLPDFSGNILPQGSYIACYQLYNDGLKGEQPLGDDCVNLHIDPLSPPLLNSPADKSELLTPYPQFTWLPPTPYDMFSSLGYDIFVTEILPGQSPSEAIQYNTPVYTRENINQPNESYPSSMTSLDTGKIYAWQVTALNGLNYAAKTDIWTFTYKRNDSIKKPPNNSFIFLHEGFTGTYVITNKTLQIKYYSFDPVHVTEIIISGPNKSTIEKVKEIIQPGNNYLTIKLKNGVKQHKMYMVTIQNLQHKNQTLYFNIK